MQTSEELGQWKSSHTGNSWLVAKTLERVGLPVFQQMLPCRCLHFALEACNSRPWDKLGRPHASGLLEYLEPVQLRAVVEHLERWRRARSEEYRTLHL